MKRGARRLAWGLLAAVYLVALFPDFFSPHSPTRQYRDLPYAPPGRYHGELFLLGTDEFGRDWYSRLCHGAFTSLLVAPAAALLSLILAIPLGAWAGYRRGWIDYLVMRGSEIFVILPWFYVLVALRAALPLNVDGSTAMLIMFGLLGVLGCAAPVRLFRGLVLSVMTRDFVLAARSTGAGGARIIRSHVLPFLWPTARAQFLLALPAYILTEVTLSFLGLGLADPAPSWGSMLVPLQQYVVLTSYPWMLAPAAAIIVVCLAFHALAGHDERLMSIEQDARR